ncbi:hypothetical protein CNY89_29440, partial [Amaricoccus sp. HAR-UPW-R2A-40]
GAGMFARDVFPEAGFIAYCEWWYRHPGADMAFLAALEARAPHSGWGAGMFARDVFPEAGFIAYCEWWYRHPGADMAFL